eukprot:SAG31_NODE_201_length_20535_cov_15.315081_20_plen_188_part_00
MPCLCHSFEGTWSLSFVFIEDGCEVCRSGLGREHVLWCCAIKLFSKVDLALGSICAPVYNCRVGDNPASKYLYTAAGVCVPWSRIYIDIYFISTCRYYPDIVRKGRYLCLTSADVTFRRWNRTTNDLRTCTQICSNLHLLYLYSWLLCSPLLWFFTCWLWTPDGHAELADRRGALCPIRHKLRPTKF